MSYKWKPSAAQKKAFAEKMKDPAEQAAYKQKKEQKAEKKRDNSDYNYQTAGGYYVPTETQYDFATENMDSFVTDDEKHSANMVVSGYVTNEKVHHDHIHVVNEKMRTQSW